MRLSILALLCCAAMTSHSAETPAPPATLRFAAVNVAMHGTRAGERIDKIGAPSFGQAMRAAAALQ